MTRSEDPADTSALLTIHPTGTHAAVPPSGRTLRREQAAIEQQQLIEHLTERATVLSADVAQLEKKLDAYGEANREFAAENARLRAENQRLTDQRPRKQK